MSDETETTADTDDAAVLSKAAPAVYPRPGEALEAAMMAGFTQRPVFPTDDGRIFAMVPGNYHFKDVTDPHRLRPRPSSCVTVDDRQSQINYLNRFKESGSVLLADIDAQTITGLVDYHLATEGGAAPAGDASEVAERVRALEHSVVLALRVSEEFRRWDEFEGGLHAQDEFAHFLDENAADVADPEAASLIEVARDLEAVQGVNFKSSYRSESGDRTFRYEEETQTRGEVTVPRKFLVDIPLYAGESPIVLEARLSYRVTPSGLLLGFNWHRVEYARQALFRQIATTVSEETGVPAFFGRKAR